MSAEGLVTLPSRYGVHETMERLVRQIGAKGLTVFARIDHAAGAAEARMSLRPTQLVIFGNAKGGTPLMQSQQTVGIDLPLKALVWEDAQGRAWLSYNDPGWIAQRHGLAEEAAAAVAVLSQLLAVLARTTTEAGAGKDS